MPSFSTESARPCGKGQHSPAGSVTNLELANAVRRYKRGIASRYSALVPDELEGRLPPGPYLVSPKVDGEQWCMVFEDGDVFLANPAGRVLSGNIPVLEEARKALPQTEGTTVIAGELFAARKEGRSRHGDLASALSGRLSEMKWEKAGAEEYGLESRVQADAVQRELGVFDTPDTFYADHESNLSGLRKFLYGAAVRHVMNRNIKRIREGRGPLPDEDLLHVHEGLEVSDGQASTR